MAPESDTEAGSLRRLYDRCTTWGVLLLGWLLRLLPTHAAVELGGYVGVLAHRFDHARRNRARKNLRLALGAETRGKQRKAIVREMYRNIGRLAFEYAMLLSGRDLRPYSRWLEMENLDVARAAIQKYGAIIFVTCHGGNFDLLGAYAAEQVVKLNVIIKDLENPFLTERLLATRERLGLSAIRKFPALRTILRLLRDGQSIAMLCDQRRRKRGLIVEFFGRPAATIDTPAVLALRFGIPIVPGFCWRTGRGLRYRGYVEDPILADPKAPRNAEVVRVTQAVNDAIERFIRAHPEQWNWTQERWQLPGKVRRRARARTDPTDAPELPPPL